MYIYHFFDSYALPYIASRNRGPVAKPAHSFTDTRKFQTLPVNNLVNNELTLAGLLSNGKMAKMATSNPPFTMPRSTSPVITPDHLNLFNTTHDNASSDSGPPNYVFADLPSAAPGRQRHTHLGPWSMAATSSFGVILGLGYLVFHGILTPAYDSLETSSRLLQMEAQPADNNLAIIARRQAVYLSIVLHIESSASANCNIWRLVTRVD
ncbi:hypothetical protein D9615_008303 [Tricholomella constricta]|uniref:Uncharacterized protein n=1 Tax=Tricholomella constricta TaxID=117010 RepID=A0A8H5M4Y0_9AGAR|nr:hypothetical protein D9615_008303 [Tricholomella constricta]